VISTTRDEHHKDISLRGSRRYESPSSFCTGPAQTEHPRLECPIGVLKHIVQSIYLHDSEMV
jgi:hypothetical protein